MELTTALIWTLRIVLPIILFCIYFRFQSSKDDQLLLGSSGKNKYPIRKLLAYRKAVEGDEVPQEFANLALKSQAEAPELFQGGERAGKGKGGGKKGREPRDREDRAEKGGKERDRRARDSDKPEKQRSSKKEKEAETGPATTEIPAAAPAKSEEAPEELPPSAVGALQMKESEEKMNLESFLNYVAFNKKAQAPASQLLDLSEANADRANAEAQMVLRGAMGFKRVDVAKDLFAQLDAASVDVSAETFTLMIEACVVAKDLKAASDFLMKMEASGHSPNSELLDKVLDLYSNQQPQKDISKVQQDSLDTEIETEEMVLTRQKLKSDAPIFVPSFGIPPPPPKPKPMGEEPDEGGVTDAGSDGRTKLTSAAKPFEPNQWTEPETAAEEKTEVRERKTWSKHGKRSEEPRKMWKPKEPVAAQQPEETE